MSRLAAVQSDQIDPYGSYRIKAAASRHHSARLDRGAGRQSPLSAASYSFVTLTRAAHLVVGEGEAAFLLALRGVATLAAREGQFWLPAGHWMCLPSGSRPSIEAEQESLILCLLIAEESTQRANFFPGRGRLPRGSRPHAFALWRAAAGDPSGCDSTDIVGRTLYFLRSLQAPIAALAAACPGHTSARRRQVLHRLQSAASFLAGNLQSSVCLSTLASMCHMSRWYFTKVFKAVYGMGPREMTAAMRVELAAILLDHTCQSVGDIAHQCGFRSASTFARAFKRSFGLSAMAYRDRPRLPSLTNTGQLFQVATGKQPLR